MEKERLNYFKNKLLREKEDVEKILRQMAGNETYNTGVEFSVELSELSVYDNHPSDIATELFDEERGRALKEHELSIIGKIEDSLKNIETGQYGTCKMCGKKITEERLEFIPYVEFCVDCQNSAYDSRPREKDNRAVEEDVLMQPFGYGFTDFNETESPVGFDAEDSYQAVQRYDWRKNADYDILEEDADVVEPIEKISNQQYRSQLPD